MFGRHPAERPEGVLQAGGERDEALPVQHDVAVLEAAEDEPEVVEPVRQPHPDDGDTEPGEVCEVRKAHPARLVGLAEDQLTLRAMQGAPLTDAPLQRPTDADTEIGMAPQELLQNGDRPEAGARLQHRHDLGVEHVGQWVRASPPAWATLLGGRSRVVRDPIPGGDTEPGPRGGHGHGIGQAMLHEEPHLVIGHVAAGHGAPPKQRKLPNSPTGRDHPQPSRGTGGRFGGVGSPVGLRPPCEPKPPNRSHPD